MANIYVSSTFRDLREHRTAVRDALRGLGHVDVAMEHYAAEGRPPLERCLEDVATCDLYVLVVAWRYGHCPSGHGGRSITELEYRAAGDAGKHRLVFLLDEDEPWRQPQNLEDYSRAGRWRARLLADEGQTIKTFGREPRDLAAVVVQAVALWEQRSAAGGRFMDWSGYRNALLARYRWLPLTAIDPRGALDDVDGKVPLRHAFVPQPAISGRPQVGSAAAEDPDAVARPESGLALIGRERCQVVLGGPGIGKSTLLHYVLLTLVDGEHGALPHVPGRPVPFFVDLRLYASDPAGTFVEFVVSEMKRKYVHLAPDDVDRALHGDEGAVLLLDGLDEVLDSGARRRVIAETVAFATAYLGVRIVVTSRIVGYERYEHELRVADFVHYTPLGFGLHEIRQFLPTWFTYVAPRHETRGAETLVRRIGESRSLRELAGNPLLLTMTAVIYRSQDLPEKRWQLYESCARVLLEDWDVVRHDIEKTRFTRDEKEAILQRVAVHILRAKGRGAEPNAIRRRPLIGVVSAYLQSRFDTSAGQGDATAAEILEHVQERTYILAEIGHQVFGFVHRTFLEYFAARALQTEFGGKRADYAWLEATFAETWGREQWREPLLLLVAMLADPTSSNLPMDSVIEHVRHRSTTSLPFSLAFAVQCLGEAGWAEDAAWAQDIVHELVRAVAAAVEGFRRPRTPEFLDRAQAAFSVAAPVVAIESRTTQLIEQLYTRSDLTARMAGWQLGLAQRSRGERLRYALAALHHPEEAVRRAALSAIEREWPRREDVAGALAAVVYAGTGVRVREQAIDMVSRLWPPSEEVREAIAARTAVETSYPLVLRYVSYLAGGWPGDEDVWPLLLALAAAPRARRTETHNRWTTAVFVAERLLAGWRERPVTRKWLTARLWGPNAQVAVAGLVIGWNADPDARRLAWNRSLAAGVDVDDLARLGAEQWDVTASGDPAGWWIAMRAEAGDTAQRTAVALRLVALVTTSDAARTWLEEAGLTDSDPSVRAGLVAALRLVPGHGLWPVLAALGERDPDPAVRLAAVREAGQRYETSWLMERAADDPSGQVRAEAITALFFEMVQRTEEGGTTYYMRQWPVQWPEEHPLSPFVTGRRARDHDPEVQRAIAEVGHNALGWPW